MLQQMGITEYISDKISCTMKHSLYGSKEITIRSSQVAQARNLMDDGRISMAPIRCLTIAVTSAR